MTNYIFSRWSLLNNRKLVEISAFAEFFGFGSIVDDGIHEKPLLKMGCHRILPHVSVHSHWKINRLINHFIKSRDGHLWFDIYFQYYGASIVQYGTGSEWVWI
jgi:hypothetical protein